MRFLLPAVLLAACSQAPEVASKPRSNRVLLAISLINPKAECYPIATPAYGPDADTAYCALSEKVMFCRASANEPISCALVGNRELEKPPAPTIPPPVAAGGAK